MKHRRTNGTDGQNGRSTGKQNGRHHDRHHSGHVLITGGAGFIGTNLASRLLAEGATVVVYDNLSREGVRQNLDWLKQYAARIGGALEVEIGDVRDADRLRGVVRGARAVYHLAAQVAVTTSLLTPREDFEVNAGGTLNVLEACRECGESGAAPAVLFTSTNKVYGQLADVVLRRDGTRYLPTDGRLRRSGIGESRPLDFHSPYGCSKGAADQYVLDYARCFGLPTVVFRMSCIYGPHQCGNEDQGWVAHFAREIMQGRPVTFYGDGCQVRDLLFVEDLVAAMRAATDHIDQLAGQAFNIGGGPQNAASLRDVVATLGRIHGDQPDDVKILSGEWRAGDQRYYVSDTTAFRQATGWSPQVSVPEGLGRLSEWLSDHHDAKARKRKAELTA